MMSNIGEKQHQRISWFKQLVDRHDITSVMNNVPAYVPARATDDRYALICDSVYTQLRHGIRTAVRYTV